MELNNEDVKDELLKSANEKRKTFKQFKRDLNIVFSTKILVNTSQISKGRDKYT